MKSPARRSLRPSSLGGCAESETRAQHAFSFVPPLAAQRYTVRKLGVSFPGTRLRGTGERLANRRAIRVLPKVVSMEQNQRPSSVRSLIVAAATLMSFLLYLDRFCVGIAEPYIQQDLGLTKTQMSWFVSGFFWTYALAQVPSGWLSDRYGARTILAAYIVAWSLFTAAIGAAYGFALLIVARLGCGLFQAGAYPISASIIGRWMPITSRGQASSLVGIGGRIGAMAAPVMTAYLIVQFVPLSTPTQIEPADVLAGGPIAKVLVERVEFSQFGSRSMLVADESDPLTTTEVALLFPVLSINSDTKAVTYDERVEHLPKLCSLLNHIADSDALLNIARDDKTLKLPRDSLAILGRLKNNEPVPEFEQRRLKRLTLEALFPNEIKKLYRFGWRPVVMIYGGAGVLVAGFFWLVFRERPELHPRVNEAELALIREGRSAASQEIRKASGIPFKKLFQSRNMWANGFMQLGTNVGWLFIFTWLPRYLLEEHQVPIIERSYMSMLPIAMGVCGGFMGGKLTDIWATRFGVIWGRRLPILTSRVLAISGYCGCIAVSFLAPEHPLNSPWVVTALCGVAAYATDFGAPATWAFSQDVGGRHIASVLGWGNMWGNIGAAIGPLIYNYVLGEKPVTHDWNVMFGVCALSFAVSGLMAFVMDATEPLIPADEES